MKNLKKDCCCFNCERFYSFDYDIQSLCKYYTKLIQGIHIPEYIDIKEYCCNNFKKNG